jgi:hypothetical protein
MSDGTKESYFKALFNKEFPVNLEDLDNLPVQKHILHLIRTTNEDGTTRAFKGAVTHSAKSSSEPLVSGLAFSALHSKLHPFLDYTSAVTTETSTKMTTLTNTGKHSLAGHLLEHSSTTCIHCKFPKEECLETLFGTSISHYLKKVATKKGVIYYGENDEDHREPKKVVLDDYKRLLTQLKFAVVVMNGTSLPCYPDNAENPYILKGSGCEDRPLPDCIVKGSYEKFMWWLSDQQTVHEWGYDISGYDICDDIEEVGIPMCVVNYYREQSGIEF